MALRVAAEQQLREILCIAVTILPDLHLGRAPRVVIDESRSAARRILAVIVFVTGA